MQLPLAYLIPQDMPRAAQRCITGDGGPAWGTTKSQANRSKAGCRHDGVNARPTKLAIKSEVWTVGVLPLNLHVRYG